MFQGEERRGGMKRNAEILPPREMGEFGVCMGEKGENVIIIISSPLLLSSHLSPYSQQQQPSKKQLLLVQKLLIDPSQPPTCHAPIPPQQPYPT